MPSKQLAEACSSVTFINFYHIIWHHIPGDSTLQSDFVIFEILILLKKFTILLHRTDNKYRPGEN
jgi:hypothetical protein